jgi:hypothetical protein
VIGGFVTALAGRGKSWRERLTARPDLLALAMGAVLLSAVYVITPYSALGPDGDPVQTDANTRYLLPAILLAVGASAGAAAALGRRDRRLEALVQAVVLLAVLDGLHHGLHASFTSVVEVVVALAVLMAGLAVARALIDGPIVRIGLAVAGLILVVAVIAGRAIQVRFDDATYRGADPALDTLLARSPSGGEIGLAGTWSTAPPAPPLPTFGTRLGNHVSYIGPVVDGMLRRYQSCAPLLDRLQDDGIELLLVGRGAASHRSPEETCVDRAGFTRIAASPRFSLFALPSAG